MKVPFPDAPSGAWREVRWRNGSHPQTLERASIEADPRTAFRQLRVYRAEGLQLLANESWDQSRTRAVRIWPEDTTVAAGEELLLRAMAWWPAPVQLTAVLTWKGSE